MKIYDVMSNIIQLLDSDLKFKCQICHMPKLMDAFALRVYVLKLNWHSRA